MNYFRSHRLLSISLLGLIVITVATIGVFQHPPIAQAASGSSTFTPEVPIPGLFDKTVPIDNNLAASYIRAIYVYFIWIVGILAVVMVIFGGIKWVAAAGNTSRINDARETINNAVIGIIIALTAVLLLNIIDPNLVKLGLPDIGVVQTNYFQGANAPSICDQSLNVDCNVLQLIDGSQNPKVYCMGAKCSKDSVCNVTTVTLNNGKQVYAGGNGCVSTVQAVYKTATTPEAPLSFQYIDASGKTVVTPIDTMKITGAQNGQPSCGYASAGLAITSYCPKGNCYMTGDKADFPTNPISLGPAGTVGAGTIANNFNCSL